LTPDDCVARGTTLYAAMSSPYFSLKDFLFEHVNNSTLILEYPFFKNEKVETRTTKLVNRNEVFPTRKSIKFSEKQIPKDTVLDLKFFYSLEELNFLKNSLLKNYMIGIPKVKEEQYTLALEFYLDSNNLFNLDKAYIVEVYYEEKVVVPPKQETTTTPNTQNTTTNNTNTTNPSNDSNMTNQTTTEQQPQPKPEEKKEVEKIKKERRTNCTIQLIFNAYGRNNQQMTHMIQREANQELEDKNLKYLKDKRNDIETFIYGTREKLNAELHPYTDTQEANQLLQIFSEAENWLYNSNEETFIKSKLEEVFNRVTGAGNKIYNRKSAWDQLESSLNNMRGSVNKHVSKFEEQFKLAKDNKSLLLKNEMDDLQKVIQTYNDVYNEAVNGLAGAKKN